MRDKDIDDFKKIKGNIDKNGFPFINIDIINPENKRVIEKVKAIIDTCASGTHIKTEIINSLLLKKNGESNFYHAQGENIKTDTYNVDLFFNDKIRVPNVNVFILHQEIFDCDILIGQNIIKHCNFIYDSVQKSFSFHLFHLQDY